MDIVFQVTPYLAGLLEVLILLTITRKSLQEFPFLYSAVLVLLLTNAVDAVLYARSASVTRTDRAYIYYFNEMVRQLSIFLLVVSLIYKAVADRPQHRRIVRWLVIGIAFLGLALVLIPTDTKWVKHMTNVVRTLSVAAIVMNLFLWIQLIRERTSQRIVLLISSGLGLQMTADAMGNSLRLLSPDFVQVGNFVLILAHLMCLYVWWSAFRKKAVVPVSLRQKRRVHSAAARESES